MIYKVYNLQTFRNNKTIISLKINTKTLIYHPTIKKIHINIKIMNLNLTFSHSNLSNHNTQYTNQLIHI